MLPWAATLVWGLLTVCVSLADPPCERATFRGNSSLVNDGEYGWRASKVVALPGLGLYNSLGGGAGDVSVRIITGSDPRLSTPPTVAVGYFSPETLQKPNEDDLMANMNAGAYSSALSAMAVDVIEFEDVNGNLRFDPALDRILQTISLSSPQSMAYGDMCSWHNISDPLTTFNLTSSPRTDSFVASIELDCSSIVGVLTAGRVITPKSGVVRIRLSGFPYIGTKTYLAVGIVFASHCPQDPDAGLNFEGKFLTVGTEGEKLYFGWSPYAEAAPSTTPSTPAQSPLTRFSKTGDVVVNPSSALRGNTTDVQGLAQLLFFSYYGLISMDVKKVYFAFGIPQPSFVSWDAEIGSGTAPEEKPDPAPSSKLWIIPVVAIPVLLLVCYCARRHALRRENEAKESILFEEKIDSFHVPANKLGFKPGQSYQNSGLYASAPGVPGQGSGNNTRDSRDDIDRFY